MTATIHSANGRSERKQLSDQLDRLDTVLDGLSEGLNEAVADAVRDATRLALKDVMIEIMTDPSLRAKLHQATAPATAAKRPGFWARLKATASAVGKALRRACSLVVQGIESAATAVDNTVRILARRPLQLLGVIASARQILAIGAGVGLAIAAVSIVVPQEVAAAVSGVSSAIAAMTLRIVFWTRRAVVFPLT